MTTADEIRILLKKYFDHDVVYVSHERREEALTAILSAIEKRVKDAPVNKHAKYTCCLENGLNARNIIIEAFGKPSWASKW